VSSISAIPADFAFSGEFETFRRAFMRFNFWHQNILEKYRDSAAAPTVVLYTRVQ
jgi:hypothetical protein